MPRAADSARMDRGAGDASHIRDRDGGGDGATAGGCPGLRERDQDRDTHGQPRDLFPLGPKERRGPGLRSPGVQDRGGPGDRTGERGADRRGTWHRRNHRYRPRSPKGEADAWLLRPGSPGGGARSGPQDEPRQRPSGERLRCPHHQRRTHGWFGEDGDPWRQLHRREQPTALHRGRDPGGQLGSPEHRVRRDRLRQRRPGHRSGAHREHQRPERSGSGGSVRVQGSERRRGHHHEVRRGRFRGWSWDDRDLKPHGRDASQASGLPECLRARILRGIPVGGRWRRGSLGPFR